MTENQIFTFLKMLPYKRGLQSQTSRGHGRAAALRSSAAGRHVVPPPYYLGQKGTMIVSFYSIIRTFSTVAYR